MATIKITYELSLNGQRASLLAGGNGHLEQTVCVPATAELLEIAKIDEAGQASYELSCWGPGAQGGRRRTQYAAPLTPEVAAATVLAEEVARAEAAAAEDKRAAAEKATNLAIARRVWDERSAAALAGNSSYAVTHSGARVGVTQHPHTRMESSLYGKFAEPIRVWVTQHPHTRMESSLSAEECGVSQEEAAALVAAFAPIAAARERQEKEEEARAEETAARKAAAAAAKIAERDAWIVAHGSNRLKKGLAAGLFDKMAGAYRSERIAVDLGDTWFSWDAVAESDDSDRLNPREAEIDAFLETRLKWPATELEIQLRSVSKKPTEEECAGEHPKKSWRPALMMRLPWEIDKWAIRFLDRAQ